MTKFGFCIACKTKNPKEIFPYMKREMASYMQSIFSNITDSKKLKMRLKYCKPTEIAELMNSFLSRSITKESLTP